ncbi:NeuD/PglB/VioB family sugar acetyltransferase [Siphonobacter sp. SORGH_AS_0500]|uniref:NeuD/PglB/VioB family sugar acetyltransferase n=1 Tax=Siphonobacter sp. SORGH_AS_0500 TaxID=1864824 RepID=UPI000CC7D9D6|nr:NeuD/PglB/VioB family sugar acetyltransferase [Siphonobacter sp. SORGH_AS_0500]MDR6196901.1 sugar O-acyltransferase (sialic acid O-acetyltransferase NeuD family) [Siphonobacter sp. SORGH_AS_0500]PKK36166.1 acetyltransferase [Siphonobacter sp. SORGH_AS_0500]
MENPVLIFGAKALGKTALDIFNRNGVIVYGFLEDETSLHGTEIGEVSVFSATDDEGFTELIGNKCEAFIAVEDRTERKTLVEYLHETRQTQPVNAVHPSAIISEDAHIGHGNLIAAGVIVQTFSKVSNHCILHAGVIIDTETVLEDFVQVGAGSVIGMGAKVGENTFIGSGVTIVGGVEIGKNARIGAGSVVIENVAAGATVFGNPAKKV